MSPSRTQTRIGYARISTADQTADLQLDALRAAGCEKIFVDQASGTLRERPELSRALDYVRPGDALVTWRLDRLGRSLRHLLDLVGQLQQRDVGLISLTESLDTTTPAGRLVFHVFGSLAEFERELMLERTHAGLVAARARGRVGGRPPVLTGDKLRAAQDMYASRRFTLTEIANAVGVSRATLYRRLPGGAGDSLAPSTRRKA